MENPDSTNPAKKEKTTTGPANTGFPLIPVFFAGLAFIAAIAITAYIVLTYPTTGSLDETEDATFKVTESGIVKEYESGKKSETLVEKTDIADAESITGVYASPDNDYVCFLVQTVAPQWMYIIKTNGTGLTRVDAANECIWSNDGTMIAYTNHTTDVSPHNVLVYTISSKEIKNYTKHLSSNTVTRIYSTPSWSNDDATVTAAYRQYTDPGWVETSGTSVIDVSAGTVTDQ